VIVDLVAAVLGLAAGRNSGRSVGALVVTVGSSDNNLEIIAALASVSGSLLGNLLSPDGALVVDNGGRVRARALVRVPLRVTLDVDVETSAGLAIVAELGAGIDIVAIESLVGDVATTGGSTLKVDEGLLVAGRSLGPNSKVLVLRVVQETLGSVILGRSASTLGLRSTWVIRVDETAVGADLDGSGASCDRGKSVGVGPAHWGAGRGNDTISSGRGLSSLACRRCDDRVTSTICGCRLGRLRRRRLRSRRLGLLGPCPSKSAGFKVLLVNASLHLSSLGGSNACSGSGSGRLCRALDVGSLLSRTNTNGRALGGSTDGVKRSRIECLRGRAGGDEGSSPENNCVTHSEG